MKPTIRKILLFQNLTLNYPRSRPCVRYWSHSIPSFNQPTSVSFHINRTNHSSDKAKQYFHCIGIGFFIFATSYCIQSYIDSFNELNKIAYICDKNVMTVFWCFLLRFVPRHKSGNSCHTVWYTYRQVSNISRTLLGNRIVDHSDVVGASPVGAAPTTSSFLTERLASLDWATVTWTRDKKHISFGIRCVLH